MNVHFYLQIASWQMSMDYVHNVLLDLYFLKIKMFVFFSLNIAMKSLFKDYAFNAVMDSI